MTRQKAVGLLLGLFCGWAALSANAQFSYPYYWIPEWVGYGQNWTHPYYGYPPSSKALEDAGSPQPGAAGKQSAAPQPRTAYQAPPSGSWSPSWGGTYYPCPHFSARPQQR